MDEALTLSASQDLTTDKDSIALIESFVKAGKPVASVCHGTSFSLTLDERGDRADARRPRAGPTVFLNVTDPKTGEPFVKGKKVRSLAPRPPLLQCLTLLRQITCFSDDEERQAGLVDSIPFLVETELRKKGADFQLTRQAWGEEVVVDGGLITGGNPASASGMGKALLAALEKA